LAGQAIENVVEPIPVSHQSQLPLRATNGRIHQDRDVRRIPIVHVVWRELKMPLQLSRIGMESHDGRGVQIIGDYVLDADAKF
jgi:hypothetical protein